MTEHEAQSPATKINPKDDAEMILIPAGEFLMGDDDQNDNPRRKVILSAYYIYKNLVTVGMYEKFCQDTRREMPSAPDFNPNWFKKDHPIVDVSWEDAKAYCDWAGGILPTEEQWEKAARGTQGRKYPWGDTFDTSKLRCSMTDWGDAGGTASVDSYPLGASPFGVLDMAGNVWQWCADWYYAYGIGSQTNPSGVSSGDYRVLRGGSWCNYDPVIFRSAYRARDEPSFRDSDNGFRCCAPPGLC
jgi:formylglycine-generating enzyme required for sulfatase activity